MWIISHCLHTSYITHLPKFHVFVLLSTLLLITSAGIKTTHIQERRCLCICYDGSSGYGTHLRL